ncbi:MULTISPECIES: SDR family NAD(P)-dependent oxidoreductase [unclassified Mesorhizobium]|uniref:SDR family NAD(P)-dependent oxidoreductase n=1 Tax=unclassified Mesorhizobium TaxID=325217 RepID=UPI000FDA6383|nr:MULTISPECIES: SDR family NAD(P)-dependent oxidoreductase [unclassified Mesorhizobium]TGR18807.1 SDR family oxidoreductase [Mesorhizobium sp. M8A.F.Ca.ET.197.01.1.1]TGR37071.1 SDR family oxidoreductase [bacterium M00.F.Ca.ET.199.01.1.1]TGR41591.1 SDR family oxidoreductase [Mesorhizobium sp. M8A.F.Ca.ET.198.01.1.1]TGV85302.1 SDR family oxidoreductase [Mesorhizobium sp. M00.F.Ca.ET.149.01.1.1]
MSQTPSNPPSKSRLSERRIVITGAASGIGRATARLFMEEGARVILLDRNQKGLEATLEGGNGVVGEVDITREGDVQEVIDSCAKQIGGIDGVINAAGIMLTGPTVDMSFETWRKVIDVNLSGSFIVAKVCLPWLLKQEGATIVNVASGAGLLPNAPGLAAYAASKGGVIALTKALASDLAPSIRVNCVCPGMVDTPMADGFRQNVGSYALKRLADPREIARAMLFLSCSEASYITGTVLAVDGGRTFH